MPETARLTELAQEHRALDRHSSRIEALHSRFGGIATVTDPEGLGGHHRGSTL